MDEQEERDRQRNADEGRALFAAYQQSVEKMATVMAANARATEGLAERIERQNALAEAQLQQTQLLVNHMAQLQRQISAQVELTGRLHNVPVTQQPHGHMPTPQDLLSGIASGIVGHFVQPPPQGGQPPWSQR